MLYCIQHYSIIYKSNCTVICVLNSTGTSRHASEAKNDQVETNETIKSALFLELVIAVSSRIYPDVYTLYKHLIPCCQSNTNADLRKLPLLFTQSVTRPSQEG